MAESGREHPSVIWLERPGDAAIAPLAGRGYEAALAQARASRMCLARRLDDPPA